MKIIKYVSFIFMIFLININVYALNLSKNNVEIDKNSTGTVDLYANLTNESTSISFTMTYTSYDFIAKFNPSTEYSYTASLGTHNITFDTPKSGNTYLGTIDITSTENPSMTYAAVNLYSASSVTTEGETIGLESQNINIELVENAVKTEETTTSKTDKNVLKEINSDLVDIEVVPDVFEYTIKIKSDIEELDLEAIPTNKKYKVSISNQKISELEDNKITISVKTDSEKVDYIINVEVVKDVEDIEIDTEKDKREKNYNKTWVTVIIVSSILIIFVLIFRKKD